MSLVTTNSLIVD